MNFLVEHIHCLHDESKLNQDHTVCWDITDVIPLK